ncbi:hypothetical protein BGX34_006729, partial [Mortierella sp. NVP85]
MPALNDKIFLPVTIFVLNIVLAVFKFVLLCAVGAAFAIYSKYGDEYADSVRWTQSAGYLEMIKTTIGSRKSATISKSAKRALVVGLFVTVVASFLDKGIAHFVNPAFRLASESTRMVVISQQFASHTVRKTFAGWSLLVPKDENITATMEKALGSSLAIPNAKSDQVYTPVMSDYTIKCNHFNFSLNGVGLIEDGCAELFPVIRANTTHNDTVTIPRGSNRWSILMNSRRDPYNLRMATLSASLEISRSEQDECATYESTRLRPYGNIEDGDMAVVSLTSTRFTFRDKEYNTNLTSKIFAETSDELLLAMNESFKTKTIPPSNKSVELWTEVRAMNSSVDILACSYDSYKHNSDPTNRNVECVYHIINVFIVSQPFNQKIKEAAKFPKWYYQGTFMILDHLPAIQNGIHTPISLVKLRNDMAAVSDYMARLGTNVYMDYGEEKFYAEYE